ncbi:MAG: acetyltransferase [Acidobacteriota bacterium]
MADLVLFGNGDIARLADHYFTTDSEHRVVAFTVDDDYVESEEFLGRPLVPFSTVATRFPPQAHSLFVALSYAQMNHLREERCARATELGYELESYISSRCTYLTEESPGPNCFILEDNTVQPFVSIGANVTLWSGNHIGHDSVIEDHVFVSSQVVISGHCQIGRSCFLGVNSTVQHGVRLAERTLVGAAALVTKDTEEGAVLLGRRATVSSRSSDEVKL